MALGQIDDTAAPVGDKLAQGQCATLTVGDQSGIRRGAKMFEERGSKGDPTRIYDLDTARYLIRESKKK